MVNIWAGPIEVSTAIEGYSLSNTIIAGPISVSTALLGSNVESALINAGAIELELQLKGRSYSLSDRKNFVAWSKPGDVTTLINLGDAVDRTNSTGAAPMEWPGWALRVLQLEDIIIVYGTRGISAMKPYMEPIPTFGFEVLSEVGVAGAASVAGTTTVHYFVSRKKDLWRLTKKGPELLGFREFLEPLGSSVLLYDENEDRLFITNGITGYTYDEGLGGGYAKITGISDDLVASSSALTSVPMSIMTDTFDLGHRGLKHVTFVEVGTNTTQDMYAALDFRYTRNALWQTSTWTSLNSEGVARLNVTGVEFRLRLKQLIYDDVSIDYVNVRFQKHDRRFLRGPIFAQENEEGQEA